MNEGLIPRRYAKALYKVDAERSSAERSYQLMNALAQSFELNSELSAVVGNPFVDTADKLSILTAAAGAEAADSTFADFLKLLVTNRRVDIIHEIALSYLDIYRRENNIRRVEVVAAAPLDPSVEQRIKDVVESHLDGAKIDFTSRVDASLIGGFIVNVDNERLDASIRNRLKQLRQSLLN